MANVSTAAATVNANPPEEDYGSNRGQGLTRGIQPLGAGWTRQQPRGESRPGCPVERSSTVVLPWPDQRGHSNLFSQGEVVAEPCSAGQPGAAVPTRFPSHMACSCHRVGTKVGFTLWRPRRTFLLEQTWGRAVRAPNNSQELGALLNCWGHFSFPVSIRGFALCRCRGSRH